MKELLKRKPSMVKERVYRHKPFATPREVYNHLCIYLAQNYTDMDGCECYVPFNVAAELKKHKGRGSIDFNIEFRIKYTHPDSEWMIKAMPQFITHLVKWYVKHHNDDLRGAMSFGMSNFGNGCCKLFFSYDKSLMSAETLEQCMSC